MRNTAPIPGWKEIGADDALPPGLQGDVNLLGLRAFLAYEIGFSPTRLVTGGNVGTRKRLQMLLAQPRQPAPSSLEHMPGLATETPTQERPSRRGVLIDAALDTAMSSLDRASTPPAAQIHERGEKRAAQGPTKMLASSSKHGGEPEDEEWIMVNSSQSSLGPAEGLAPKEMKSVACPR
jgi:hypothetical protein